MSLQHPTPNPFKQHVWANPEICNNCYHRCRIVTTYQRRRGDNRPRSIVEYTDDGDRGEDSTTHDNYGAIQTYHPAITCQHCGSVNLHATSDTKPRRTLLENATEIADRLREQIIDVDEHALREFVRIAKTRTTKQGRDTEILEHATAYATHRDPNQ